MLILTCRATESIVIGSAVEVQVLGIGHGRVKLSIMASPDVHIRRKELRERAAAAKPVNSVSNEKDATV